MKKRKSKSTAKPKSTLPLPADFYHQKFLQYFLCKKCCHFYDVVKLYQECWKTEGSDNGSEAEVRLEDVTAIISKLNAVIEPYHMRIAKGDEEKSGEPFYALVSTETGKLARLQTAYSKNQVEYFQRLMAEIVCSEEGKVDNITAINLIDKVSFRTTKRELEDLINKFCRDQWLVDENDCLSLSIRSRLEFAPFVLSEFREYIDICTFCKEMIIQYYVLCRKCHLKVHEHCQKKYLMNTNTKNCPNCNVVWKNLE